MMKMNLILRLVAITVILVTCLTFLFWNAGLIDLPFLPQTPILQSEGETQTPMETAEESGVAGDMESSSDLSGAETQAPMETEIQIPSFPTVSQVLSQGGKRTEKEYDGTSMVIARLEMDQDILSLPVSSGTKSVKKMVRKETSASGITITTRVEQEPILSITPYMGYLIAYGEQKTYLIDKSGTVIREDFPDVTLVYATDANGRAVVSMNGSYYAISETGSLLRSDFTPVASMVYSDAPQASVMTWPKPFSTTVPIFQVATSSGGRKYTEAQKNQILSAYSEKVQALSESAEPGEEGEAVYYTMKEETRWGYKNKNGEVVIEPIYIYAFPFGTDGYGPVVTYNKLLKTNVLIYINANGNKLLDITGRYYKDYTVNAADVYEGWFVSLTSDEASIGSYYFEHGYVRVRQRMLITHQIDRAYLDRDILVNKSGEVFELPEGYSLISYSCGVMLLEKNGRYGYMDIHGKWIAQPIYTDAEAFYGGLAVVQKDGKYGVIDTDGNFVLPCVYTAISHAVKGMFTVYHPDKGWEVLCLMQSA